MSTVREIIQLGHPTLRGVAAFVGDALDPRIQAMAGDLLATLAVSQGVGIAAPQIGESLQTIVIASRPSPRYPLAPLMEPVVMHNPRFLEASGHMVDGWEGCLSIPGLRGLVRRHQSVRIGFLDATGAQREMELEGFPARIFQHEYDHLQGLVFLDRVKDNRQLMSDTEYHKMMATASS